MTNFEKWRYYMKDINSPDSFIDMGFYYMIAAALQRRVWLHSEHRPIFPNQYVLLIAEPGVGKGMVIKPVSAILKHHRIKLDKPAIIANMEAKEKASRSVDPEEFAKLEEEAAEMLRNNGLPVKQTKNPVQELPMVIPVAPEATTYEALVRALSKCTRRINYIKTDEAGNKSMAVYTHSSLCFSLEELGSLMRKHTNDTVNLMLQAYDCGDYIYETKTQGTDKVTRCCLNFLGGTTPSFMKSIFNQDLINEGFSSRTWCVYEHTNRSRNLFVDELHKDQLQAYADIVAHVGELSKLFGQVTMTSEAKEYLKHWFEHIDPVSRPNNSLKLIPYYSRKNLHVQKLAMAIHFAESLTMEVTLEDCQKAMSILDKLELKMHFALNFDSRNPLAGTAKDVEKFIEKAGGQTIEDLYLEFVGQVNELELQEVLNFLLSTSKAIRVERKVSGGSKTVRVYELPHKFRPDTDKII